ncbi:MAG: PEP-CTERM sorting domain-containing protein [Microcystis aeruginosa W11-06]|nr:PEP-CTERM sorting domain-containing protein [Microcystis aeruginosa W11-03]NCR93169.1 PEP-CTERM sorting domain-containing protein [Microcystis aeruginosa W11-06]
MTKVDFTPLVTPSADWNKATSSATKYGAGDKQDFWNITKGDCKDCVTLDARKVPEPSSILGILAIGTLGAASTLKRKLKSSKLTEKETTKVS